ncbi:MAG: hypothetical protein LN414_06360, partial [Candidatus Thermoplasmatota archaeon]|nr:hypothetical protein [Candidatus Thermoplasmatota archaeon]
YAWPDSFVVSSIVNLELAFTTTSLDTASDQTPSSSLTLNMMVWVPTERVLVLISAALSRMPSKVDSQL